MKITENIFWLFVFAIAPLYLHAQDVTIETSMDTNVVELGRKAELKYTVTRENADKVYLPIFQDTLAGGLELSGEILVDSSEMKGKYVIEQTIPITSFDEGMYYIPPQPFVISSSLGNDTLYSKDTYLKVVGVQLDTTGVIRDIADVEHVKWTFRDYLPYIIIILVLGLIPLFIYVILPRLKKKNVEEQENEVHEPAHVIALRELDKLKAQKLWQQAQVKEYYSRLTNVIRKYLENQFTIQAMEGTTNEIIRDIRLRGLDANINMKDLRGLLNLADLIKFAKGNANPEENMEQLENAYRLIKDTVEMEPQLQTTVKVKEGDEFMKFVFSGIEHAIDSIKNTEGILTPFVITKKGEDQTLKRFVSDDYKEGVKLAESYLRKLQPRPEWALLAYDGVVTIESKRNKAIYVKGYEKKEQKGLSFVQRYQPKTAEFEFQLIGNPALVGKEENVLRQV